MVRRSGPMPKAKPMYFSGSRPMLRTTLGCTWHEPATSSQRPANGPVWNWMSISALGSVKGKKLGRKRSTRSSLSKNVRQKSVKMTLRSLKLTFSPTHRPSHWWNMGECVAFGDVKTHGAKDALDAFKREGHRVKTTLPALAAWQAHIQCLGLELKLQFCVGQRLAACGQCGFNGLLGHIDGCATGFFFLDGQLRHALHQLGHAARLAQKLRLGVFQISGGGALGKQLRRALDQGIQLVHTTLYRS